MSDAPTNEQDPGEQDPGTLLSQFAQEAMGAALSPRLDGNDPLTLSFDVKDAHLAGGALDAGYAMGFAALALRLLAASTADVGAVSPLSINSDFTGTAKDGERVTACAQITRRTRSVIFADVSLSANGRNLLTATAVYKITPAE